MKTILLLGGSEKSIPLVTYARSKGHKVLLCDSNPDAPCVALSDEFVGVSATDLERLVEVGRDRRVDAVLSYASDLMAESAAYVGNKLGLPSNPYDSVHTMCHKDKFREFLNSNGFTTPRSATYTDIEDLLTERFHFRLPVMVKPVDSSGSNAVRRIECWDDLSCAFNAAQAAARSGKVIVEEFVAMAHEHMIAGDAFVLDGKVAFWGLLNSHRCSLYNPCIPTGNSYPLAISTDQERVVKAEVQRAVDCLGIQFGPLNLELMFDARGDIYIIEMAPRNGGNSIVELLKMSAGVDLVRALVDVSVGDKPSLQGFSDRKTLGSYMLHSNAHGSYQGITLDRELDPYVFNTCIYIAEGAIVQPFSRATHAIGVLFFAFPSVEEQKRVLARCEELIHVELVP